MTHEIIDPNKAKEIIRRNAENAADWPYRDEAKDLNHMAVLLKNRLIDPVLRLHRLQMPDPIIGFDDAGNRNILAYYNTKQDAYGNPDQIIFNTAHYIQKEGRMVWAHGEWSKYEVEAHELGHLYLNFLSKVEGRKIPAHGKEFCTLLESWGLHPVPGIGCHDQPADPDKPFGIFMREMGFVRPDDIAREEGKPVKTDWFRPKKEKGKSTLHKWICPDCGLSVRLGIGADPKLVHDICTEKKGEKVFLVKSDGGPHTIYKAK